MPTFSKPRSSRPSEARRHALDRAPAWRRLGITLPVWHLIVAAGFFGLACLVVLWSEEQTPHLLNQELTESKFARVGFQRVDEVRTQELRKKAQQEVPEYYRFNQTLADRIQQEMMELIAAAKAAEDFEKFHASAGDRWKLDTVGYSRLKQLTNDAGSEQFKRDVESLVRRLRTEYMVESTEADPDMPARSSLVRLEVEPGKLKEVSKVKLFYAKNKDHVSSVANRVTDAFPPEFKGALAAIIVRSIAADTQKNQYRPIYEFDRERTRRERTENAAAVPEATITFEPGDLLVKAGRVDPERLALLNAEHEEFLKQRKTDPVLRSQWRKKQIGLAGAILIISLGLSLFSYRYEPRIAKNPTRALAIAVLLLLMLGLNRLLAINHSPIWSIGAITLTAAMLTIAYSRLFAIGITSLLALLTVMPMDDPVGLFVVLLCVGSVTTLLLKEIRTRLRMVQVGGVTALSAGVSTFVVGMVYEQRFEYLAWQSFWAALAAMAGTGAILILLPLIERAFRIVTSLTLLEWADTSNPLLKQLIQKAPGTWQHSHLLGSMAESAAEEIGANGLLVRVGAYYHDIGKMLKPPYFVENQRTKTNAHEGLAPTMSMLVILAHVKDGLALAREYGLPPVLHQFIAEHHGTTVVRYFHARAAQEAKASGRDEREVSEVEFRYPGPKPRSPEAAILMLCDSVEGAVRALQDPTPGRIESVVHEIVMERLMDGQLDDCDITLRDLSRIEQSLVKSLCAIHHGRIAYPKAPEKPTLQVARTA